MNSKIAIVGAGLAGSEAALQLADRGFTVHLYEMRPVVATDAHKSADCAELVCSNSLKSLKPDSAAGMLKRELEALGSHLFELALRHRVPAGGALAVNRQDFSRAVTARIEEHENIQLMREESVDIRALAEAYDAVMLATGPLTSDALADSLGELLGCGYLAFFDAAAPIVMADSLDYDVLFRQSRYEDAPEGEQQGDYLNAPFSKEEYEAFIDELLQANRVIAHDFESKDLFQACQPIEEIARAGRDAPRFGPLKPVGLTDPRTGHRPWAALQLRAENAECTSYNLVGFQTNLTFPEQKRVFSMIPGLQGAEFARYGVMHRNTFIDAPNILDSTLRVKVPTVQGLAAPLYIIGQLGGTEGYCEAIRSGLHGALSVAAALQGTRVPELPRETAFGALIDYATCPDTVRYQPMHVNFGIMPPLPQKVKNKRQRYAAYAQRGEEALGRYIAALHEAGLMEGAAPASVRVDAWYEGAPQEDAQHEGAKQEGAQQEDAQQEGIS